MFQTACTTKLPTKLVTFSLSAKKRYLPVALPHCSLGFYSHPLRRLRLRDSTYSSTLRLGTRARARDMPRPDQAINLRGYPGVADRDTSRNLTVREFNNSTSYWNLLPNLAEELQEP